jgi:hypothetical protein
MTLKTTEEQVEKGLDWLKWLVASILVLAGLIGNHYYSEVSMPLRTLGLASRACIGWFSGLSNGKR